MAEQNLQYQRYKYTQLTCTSWSKYSVAYSIMELWLALSFDNHTLYQRYAAQWAKDKYRTFAYGVAKNWYDLIMC